MIEERQEIKSSSEYFKRVTIRSGALQELEALLTPLTRHCSHICILSDNTVMGQYGDEVTEQIKLLNIPHSHHLLAQGESNKSIDAALTCWQKLDQAQLDRRSLIIALGGGIVTDLAGYVASTFMGGVDLVNIPTTLVGMCDAAIGGKNGVNLGIRKDLIGTSYSPKAIVIDPATLSSLPERALRSGLAEVIKYGIIADASFFQWLSENMESLLARDPSILTRAIERCCQLKCEIVDKDPRGVGCRATLSFGHTFSYAIEASTNYEQFLHGEAVAIGMCSAAQLSQQLGFVDSTFVDSVEEICKQAGLPRKLPSVSDDMLIERMLQDKKTKRGTITCLVAKSLGEVVKLDNIAPQIVRESLMEKRERDARQEAVSHV